MSDDRPVPEPDTDLEYDLAHEASAVTEQSPRHYDGDYSYDLAHDIPMPTPPDHH